MEIISNRGIKDRDMVFKRLANTEFSQRKSKREVFDFLKYWNDRIPGAFEQEELEELVNSVKRER